MNEISRRTILGTGLLAVGAAGLGAGIGVATGHATRSVTPTDGTPRRAGTPPAQNPVLVAAIERESALLERLDRAVAANPSLSASATVLRADHRAHRQALEALLPAGAPAATSPAGTSPAATSPAVTASNGTPGGAVSIIAVLRQAESAAAAAAAHDCASASAQASTQLAPLLASISACEASHAAWLA